MNFTSYIWIKKYTSFFFVKLYSTAMFQALVHPFTFTSRKLFSHFLDQISKLQLVRRALSCGGQSSMSLPLFSWVFMHCEYTICTITWYSIPWTTCTSALTTFSATNLVVNKSKTKWRCYIVSLGTEMSH